MTPITISQAHHRTPAEYRTHSISSLRSQELRPCYTNICTTPQNPMHHPGCQARRQSSKVHRGDGKLKAVEVDHANASANAIPCQANKNLGRTVPMPMQMSIPPPPPRLRARVAPNREKGRKEIRSPEQAPTPLPGTTVPQKAWRFRVRSGKGWWFCKHNQALRREKKRKLAGRNHTAEEKPLG
ncbi:hypothetical protein BS50DRAFT_53378 [Corynespora cassiicola Philippines]|uniref:Uncharacterized protein n=1 Tax=Corynespora cassiicola Philippines TaxID=1448308 RepID=A0A2T2NID7_CORCC|nr:hypothetical protein BS50DRAFT_53378 [Corynespora cassiicola Philippines]